MSASLDMIASSTETNSSPASEVKASDFAAAATPESFTVGSIEASATSRLSYVIPFAVSVSRTSSSLSDETIAAITVAASSSVVKFVPNRVLISSTTD